jgi:hypothetical protein
VGSWKMHTDWWSAIECVTVRELQPAKRRNVCNLCASPGNPTAHQPAMSAQTVAPGLLLHVQFCAVITPAGYSMDCAASFII